LLILASSSIARRRLLEQAFIPHRIIVSDLDEDQFHHSDPTHLVQLLAQAKAEAALNKLFSLDRKVIPLLEERTALIGCDSVFTFEGEVFGKPKDSKEAIERLQRMSSKHGFLHTGHFLTFPFLSASGLEDDKGKYFKKEVISTEVHFVDWSQKEIEEYVMTGEPLQCAGSFALEGRGAMFVDRINGCYSNVIGLSLPWLRKTLFQSK